MVVSREEHIENRRDFFDQALLINAQVSTQNISSVNGIEKHTIIKATVDDRKVIVL